MGQMPSRLQLAQLFKDSSKDIFGVCYFVLKEENSSMDIVMDTFEVALKHPVFHEIENPKAWLMKVARNLSLKRFRSEKRIQYDLDRQNISERFMENGGDEEHIFRDAVQEKLLEEIAMLKPVQSQCIELFYLSEQSYQEIADQTGLDLKSVKSHIQNGKRNLGIRLTKTLKL